MNTLAVILYLICLVAFAVIANVVYWLHNIATRWDRDVAQARAEHDWDIEGRVYREEGKSWITGR